MVHRSTASISTALIGPNMVVREGLRRILRGTQYRTRHVAETLNGSHGGPPFDLISFTLYGDRSELLTQVQRVKDDDRRIRVVVMGDDERADHVRSLLGAGVDGYLSSDSAPEAVLATFDAVMLGGMVVPRSGRRAQSLQPELPLASNDDERSAEILQVAADTIGRSLSVRETKILLCLMKGHANKEIARTFDIAEGTVKLHVKAILRKLHVRNRTQAALWALQNQTTLGPADVGITADHAVLLERLAKQCARLVAGETLITRQRGIISSIEQRGADSGSARRLLALLEESLRVLTVGRDRLRRDLDEREK